MSKLEMKKGGYEELEEKMQQIEKLAWAGVATDKEIETMAQRFRQVISETRNLRKMLKDVLVVAPEQPGDEEEDECLKKNL